MRATAPEGHLCRRKGRAEKARKILGLIVVQVRQNKQSSRNGQSQAGE
jgi:hypothetical protein